MEIATAKAITMALLGFVAILCGLIPMWLRKKLKDGGGKYTKVRGKPISIGDTQLTLHLFSDLHILPLLLRRRRHLDDLHDTRKIELLAMSPAK